MTFYLWCQIYLKCNEIQKRKCFIHRNIKVNFFSTRPEFVKACSDLLILARNWVIICKIVKMRNIFRFIAILIFINIFFPVYAQEDTAPRQVVIDGKTFIMHTVKGGETLYSIGKHYGVEAVLILNNNPQLLFGLKAGDILKIPVTTQDQISALDDPGRMPDRLLDHEVKRRETLYSVSRKYGVTIDDILNFNPGLGQLRRGDNIRIPQWDKKSVDFDPAVVAETGKQEFYLHEVVAGETFFAISRKYGIPVQQLQEANPEVPVLKPGIKLKIPGQLLVMEKVTPAVRPAQEEFREHVIVSGETLFSLTRKYNVTAERLVELNPALDGSFRTGTVVRIPIAPEIVEDEGFVNYLVQKGETLFRIARFYRVTTDELITWNPFLEYRNIIPGDTLKLIPGLIAEQPVTGEEDLFRVAHSECDQLKYNRLEGQAVNVVMLLPLLADNNNALNTDEMLDFNSGITENSFSPDSVQIVRSDRDPQIKFQGNSENFIHFYEGALLAVDSLRERGVNVRLTVFDTEQKDTRIRHLIATDRLKNADLIIGPVYPNEQKEVAEYAMRNEIPMVSPLSATDDFSRVNPWFFQVNPHRDIINEITADYVATKYAKSNFVVLRTGNSAQDNDLARLVREKITQNSNGAGQFRNCDFQKDGLAGLRRLLEPAQKNIIILTSINEAEVSIGMSNIHTLAPSFDITVIGSNRFTQFESINQEYFHDGQLEFLAPYWPDYKKEVTRSFVSKFRNYFKTEPNQYSMQGYDVTYFFTEAISAFGRDFRNCVHTVIPELVQGNFRFEKLPSGGYVNKGLSVVSYTKDFRVVTSNSSVSR